MTQGRSGEQDNLNFLRDAESSEFAEIRKRIVESVLHTDMSRHFATVANIQSQTAGKSWAEIDPGTRWEVFMYVLHLADISNPGKPSSYLIVRFKGLVPQKVYYIICHFLFI